MFDKKYVPLTEGVCCHEVEPGAISSDVSWFRSFAELSQVFRRFDSSGPSYLQVFLTGLRDATILRSFLTPITFNLHAGGKHLLPAGLDGKDMWSALSNNLRSERDEVLLNIDPLANHSAVRHGRFKLVLGNWQNGTYDQRFRPNGGTRPLGDLQKLMRESTAAKVLESFSGKRLSYSLGWRNKATVNCLVDSFVDDRFLGKSPYLFDVEKDPCEQVNLSKTNKKVKNLALLKQSKCVSSISSVWKDSGAVYKFIPLGKAYPPGMYNSLVPSFWMRSRT